MLSVQYCATAQASAQGGSDRPGAHRRWAGDCMDSLKAPRFRLNRLPGQTDNPNVPPGSAEAQQRTHSMKFPPLIQQNPCVAGVRFPTSREQPMVSRHEDNECERYDSADHPAATSHPPPPTLSQTATPATKLTSARGACIQVARW